MAIPLLFFHNFFGTIEGEGVNYRLVKRNDNTCEVEPITENTVEITLFENFVAPAPATIPAAKVTPPALDTANELDARIVEQLTMEAKFYFAQMGQNAIEFGKRLIAIKKKLAHGDWLNWLENNFHLKVRAAQRFMEISRRFSEASPATHLNYSQMAEMLSLPEGSEQDFIDAQAAKGRPIENQTKLETRQSVKDWKAEAEKNKREAEKYKAEAEAKDAEIEKQDAQINNLRNENVKLLAENGEAEMNAKKLQKENDYLKNNPVEVEVTPPDYEANKKKIEELQDKIAQLEKKLAEPVVEVIPADYEDNKKKLAQLQAKEENIREEVATSQALNQLFMMANYLSEHQGCLPEVLKGYLQTEGITAQRIEQIAFVSSLLKKILKDIS